MQKTPADILADTGRALFGDHHWRMPLTEALAVNERLVRRWLSGANELPGAVLTKIEQLLRDRQDTIAGILRAIEQCRNENR
jgi:hypothetical protein